MEQYHFWCRCSACEASHSGVQEAAMIGMKCRLCNGPVVPSIGCSAGLCSLQELPSGLAESGRCYRWVLVLICDNIDLCRNSSWYPHRLVQ